MSVVFTVTIPAVFLTVIFLDLLHVYYGAKDVRKNINLVKYSVCEKDLRGTGGQSQSSSSSSTTVGSMPVGV